MYLGEVAVKAAFCWLDWRCVFGEEFYFVFVVLGLVQEVGCLDCFASLSSKLLDLHVPVCNIKILLSKFLHKQQHEVRCMYLCAV